MPRRKTAYELSHSQVDTPQDVVSLFWKIAHRYRERFTDVLDLGAGDGRFAIGGSYKQYVGLEIDKRRAVSP
jgi:predicted RNA methylase